MFRVNNNDGIITRKTKAPSEVDKLFALERSLAETSLENKIKSNKPKLPDWLEKAK